MRIALDYDGTYTADPVMWDQFCDAAHAKGHEVVMVTMRHPSEGLPEAPGVNSMIYTSRKAKRPFMEALGIPVDIWIDDQPHWIYQDSQ
jgi:hypothetical protein